MPAMGSGAAAAGQGRVAGAHAAAEVIGDRGEIGVLGRDATCMAALERSRTARLEGGADRSASRTWRRMGIFAVTVFRLGGLGIGVNPCRPTRVSIPVRAAPVPYPATPTGLCLEACLRAVRNDFRRVPTVCIA